MTLVPALGRQTQADLCVTGQLGSRPLPHHVCFSCQAYPGSLPVELDWRERELSCGGCVQCRISPGGECRRNSLCETASGDSSFNGVGRLSKLLGEEGNFGGVCTSLAGAKVLEMLYVHKKEVQMFAGLTLRMEKVEPVTGCLPGYTTTSRVAG